MDVLTHFVQDFKQSVSASQQRITLERKHWTEAKITVNSSLHLNVNNGDILFLDVGGTEIHTSPATFRNQWCSGSQLSTWLSGEAIETEEDGLILIDRDGEHFRGVLDWLRDGPDNLLFSELPQSECLWCEVQGWVRSLRRESVYFGLSTLTTWCESLLPRFQPVFTHVYLTHSGTLDFHNGMFGTSPDSSFEIAGLSSHCLIPALTGTSTYSTKVVSSTCKATVGWCCHCCVTTISQDKWFKTGPCDWEYYSWLDFEGDERDVIGTHLGIREGVQSAWLTKNGCLLRHPNLFRMVVVILLLQNMFWFLTWWCTWGV
eukprot:TRINITY_DN62034_c0_g2_i1.p1 TRINITY_DN62034_c0_g2~~TRINITY_DN62034_c0_g2_i1.p1  ORF type:complete len:317 (-),score=3.49 TRINITY_DN62034_c0_g2_i1:171-1121(-)